MVKPALIRILYAGVGEESTLVLKKQIEALDARVKIHWQKDGLKQTNEPTLLVNWGAYHARDYDGTWLNQRIFANKFNQLRRMSEKEVPVPPFQAGQPTTTGEVWYARKTGHRDGDDLNQKLKTGDYYVKHVDTTKEYRVHVFRGKILRASLKVPLNDQAKLPFRTGDNWGFGTKNHGDTLGEVGKACISAVKAVGYDFGGVDVGVLPNGKPVVFEVNAAPWLGGDASRRYAGAIVEYAKEIA